MTSMCRITCRQAPAQRFFRTVPPLHAQPPLSPSPRSFLSCAPGVLVSGAKENAPYVTISTSHALTKRQNIGPSQGAGLQSAPAMLRRVWSTLSRGRCILIMAILRHKLRAHVISPYAHHACYIPLARGSMRIWWLRKQLWRRLPAPPPSWTTTRAACARAPH